MRTLLALELENRRSWHDNVVLRVGEAAYRCDSYYFVLDTGIRPDDESASKVVEVMASLLRHWMRALEALGEGGVAFLPYDFSDQSTGWLKVVREGQRFRIQPGWSSIAGWSFLPSDSSYPVPGDFTPIEATPALALTASECLSALQLSVERLKR